MTILNRSISIVFVAVICFASPALAAQLLQDGQIVIFTGTSGKKKGDTNRHVYRAKTNSLGPVRKPESASKYAVLSNTSSKLVFRGPRDTCVLSADHTFTCPKIGNGTWKVE
jgi:hypothetical protein